MNAQDTEKISGREYFETPDGSIYNKSNGAFNSVVTHRGQNIPLSETSSVLPLEYCEIVDLGEVKVGEVIIHNGVAHAVSLKFTGPHTAEIGCDGCDETLHVGHYVQRVRSSKMERKEYGRVTVRKYPDQEIVIPDIAKKCTD